jgi:hypothetical protein
MRCDGESEPDIHPRAIQVDSLAPTRLTLRAALRQSPERLPRRLGHRRVDIPRTAGKLHNLIELPRNLVCGPPDAQSPAGLPTAPYLAAAQRLGSALRIPKIAPLRKIF